MEIGTGIPSVDDALGGLVTGDNVVWICDDTNLYQTLTKAFVDACVADGARCLVVDFGDHLLPAQAGVDRITAAPGSPLGSASQLADEIERRVHIDRPTCLVVDELARVSHRWPAGEPARFFARICPAMLQAGVTAYWGIDARLGRSFVDHVRQITQCLLDIRAGRLRVLKAEGRPDALQGIAYRLVIDDKGVVVMSSPAGGRLARGLSAVRGQLGLTQHELAAIAGVTPSAISQAEAGSRGLSLDTVVRIADQLEVTVDRLLGTAASRSYRLQRHDRARRLADGYTTAMVADSTVGQRAFLMELEGGAKCDPPIEHRGVSTVAPLRGLLQIDLDDDRPVVRPGDVLMVETGSVRAFRNLRREPAACYWIVRD